jgi:uncharacterized protein (TIGR00266 family)
LKYQRKLGAVTKTERRVSWFIACCFPAFLIACAIRCGIIGGRKSVPFQEGFMQHEVLYKPSYAMLRLSLEPGETILAEAGVMVSMSTNMQVKTFLNPSQNLSHGFFSHLMAFIVGLVVALLRKALGGETVFVNAFSPADRAGELLLAPTLVGDIVHHRMNGQTLLVQAGSYLASTKGVTLKLRFSGLKGLFTGESLFLLEIGGTGDLWINAFGGIEEIDVVDGLTVDTGHIVAFEPSLTWSVQAVGGLKSTLLSGEGLVLRLSGTGKVWIQSRNLNSFAGWIRPMLPN